MRDHFGRHGAGYLVAVMMTAGVVLLRLAMSGRLGESDPLLLFVVPVVAAAWSGGWWPGLLATALGAVAGSFVMPSRPGEGVSSLEAGRIETVLFLGVGLLISRLSESLHGARRRLELHSERERAEREEAEAWRARYEAAVKASGSILYDSDRKTGRVVYGGDCRGILGYDAWELDGDIARWIALVHPEDRAIFEREVGRTNVDRTSSRADYRMIRKDGRVVWMRDDGHFVADPGAERPTRIIGFVRDVTEQRRAEAALRESEEQFRVLAASVPQVVWVADASGTVRFYNSRVEGFSGVSRREDGTWHWEPVVHPDDLDATLAAWETAVRTRTPYQCEHRIRMADGSFRWHLSLGLPVDSGGGTGLRWFGSATDIHDLRASQASLRESEARFRAFMDNTPALSFIKDEQGRYLFVSRAIEQLFGRPATEWIGKSDRELLPPDEAGRLRSNDEEVRRSGRTIRFEEVLELPEGRRDFLSFKFPIDPGDGRRLLGGMSLEITERKRAAEELAEARRRLDSALFAGEVGTFDWEVAGDRLWGDRNFARIFGYGPEASADLPIAAYLGSVHPDDRPRVDERLERVVGAGGDFGEEFRILVEGRVRWIVARGRGELDEGGRVVRVAGVVLDVTGRKLAEMALRESEERFRILVEATSQVVWETTPRGDVVVDSPSWRAFTGQRVEEWMGYGWADAIHPEDRSGMLARWDACVASGSIYRDEFRVRRVDGRWRWTRVIGVPLRDPEGRILKWVGMNTDITEAKEAEDRLRESESFYRQTLESIPGMTFTNRPDGACDYVSEQWVDFTGVPAVEQLGDGWLRVLHPEDRERAFAAWRAAVEGRGEYDLEYRVLRRDGAYEWFKVRGRAIRDASGAIVRWFGTAVNVDDLKRAEAALVEADRCKDEFLAMLAHELRNPLAPIRNALALLTRDGDDADPGAWALRVIDRQVAHMTRLVDDLLDVSRISRGKITLDRRPLQVSAFVDNAIEAARPLIEARGHRLDVAMPEGSPRVLGDATRLTQVVQNLLNNAAKYTPEGGHIRLSVATDGPEVVIEVRDDGVGIPAHLLTTVFDLFAQVDRSIDRSDGGLGVGLTLVKRLVEMHGGTVAARSAGPGRGSQFVVRLPRLGGDAAGEQLARPGPESTAEGARPRRLLIVDDNVDAAVTLARLLGRLGHDVEVVHDGHAAVEAARASVPDLALLDIGLPGMDGYEVARRMRREPSLDGTRLVALTGYGSDSDRRRAAEAGFDEHMVKPVDLDELLRVLERTSVESP